LENVVNNMRYQLQDAIYRAKSDGTLDRWGCVVLTALTDSCAAVDLARRSDREMHRLRELFVKRVLLAVCRERDLSVRKQVGFRPPFQLHLAWFTILVVPTCACRKRVRFLCCRGACSVASKSAKRPALATGERGSCFSVLVIIPCRMACCCPELLRTWTGRPCFRTKSLCKVTATVFGLPEFDSAAFAAQC
jgi:hypothetical protein